MHHTTIEDHLDEYCPKCKTKHNQEWDIKFTTMKTVLTINCDNCNYLIYKSIGVMTSGKKIDIIS